MCIRPLILPDRTVKCGQCKECLTQRAREWAFRIEEEARHSKSGYFLTLTYNDENVPIIDTIHEGKEITVTSLYKRDMVLFIKRLRKAQEQVSNHKLRVFYTGEYGGDTRRAHYHAIIFNLSRELTSFNPGIQSKKPQPDYKLEKIWKKGHVRTGRVEGGSIRYVTNYMMGKNIDTIGEQEKPFLECSKGLGKDYLNVYSKRHWENGSHKMVTPKKPEFRPNLPRYLFDRLFDKEQRDVINDIKREESEELMDKNYGIAEEKEPLDPIGYIREAKISKQKAKERYKQFLNKSKL